MECMSKTDCTGSFTPSGCAVNGFAAELRNISKTYAGSGKRANNNISLGLRRGEILCIAGENGAGKTTLMKILCGLEKQDAGGIFINGGQVFIDSPRDAQEYGIGMVHQHFMLFPEFTAAENIVMGMEPRKWGIFFDKAQANTAAAALIQEHHFSVSAEKPVQSLSVGEKQQVEICRLLYRNAEIIILDEPTSVLTDHETASFFTTLRALAKAGKSLVLITHKLHEIKQISDRVAVLRRGELVDILDTAEIDEHEIARLMMGSASGDAPGNPAASAETGTNAAEDTKQQEPVIVFDSVTVMRHGQRQALLDKVSFNIYAGEILGFAGVGGNGLGVLEAVLGGFLHPVSGKILHRGHDISQLNIRRLRNRGLAFVPADRLGVGSAPAASIAENFIVDRRGEFTRMGFLDSRAIKDFTARLIRHYNIVQPDFLRAGSGRADNAASLSGGNLQKLILAREIDQFRDYIVFSEPCWGLDFASSAFVRAEISALREKGAAIALISTNLDEILELADRIIVMYRGTIAGVFTNNTASIKEKIGACMQGLNPDRNIPANERSFT